MALETEGTGSATDWLPGLVEFNQYSGNWEPYCNALFAVFERDFILANPVFQSQRLAHRKRPESLGKPSGFWHLISEGEIEDDRIPDLRRCERISWPHPMIMEDGQPRIAAWMNERNNRKRVLLAVLDFSYVLVLEPRQDDYCLVITAYDVEQSHRRAKLEREYWAFVKSKGRP